MNNRIALPHRMSLRSLLAEKRSGSLLGILLVFVPLALVGFFGESLGAETALSKIVILLAYLLCVGIAALVMKSWGWSWRTVGLARPDSLRSTILRATGAALVALIILIALQLILLALAGPAAPASDQSEYNPLIGNLPLLLLALTSAWTNVAFGEELLFRGFLINALGRLLQQTRASKVVAVVGSSVIFGLAHLAWGWMGVLETTLFGLVLGIAYVRSGRNLWVTIIAHGFANTIKFLAVYSGAF